MLWLYAAAILFGYLLGSVPTAYLAARRLAGVDIRRLGDGNPGAGNIGRLFGRRWGVIVGGVDILKGALPVFAANLMAGVIQPEGVVQSGGIMQSGGIIQPDGIERAVSGPGMLAGAAAVAGHIWPAWQWRRGGRGAATALGVTGAVLTLPVLLAALPALAILLTTRSTTLTLAFMYIAVVIAGKALFGVSWGVTAYCVGMFMAVGAAHWRAERGVLHR